MATVSDFLIERLSQWSVTRIFGYPWDDINGVQAKKFASILIEGDPDEAAILKQTARQVVGRLLPGLGKDA
ncbi:MULTISPECIES: hypothetical protein [Pseudomonas]|uniref:hypothetical protein n=1 Tax=Pseudomonas TaxID=286 RepID=UPI0007322F5C|nr:hypothetical protein [Pseudomonas fluorescens]